MPKLIIQLMRSVSLLSSKDTLIVMVTTSIKCDSEGLLIKLGVYELDKYVGEIGRKIYLIYLGH